VYNCIILDDYTWSFRNNEHMAADSAVKIYLENMK
jgi:hypothetical protein